MEPNKDKLLFEKNTPKAWSNITGYGFINIKSSDNKLNIKSPWNHFCMKQNNPVKKNNNKKIIKNNKK